MPDDKYHKSKAKKQIYHTRLFSAVRYGTDSSSGQGVTDNRSICLKEESSVAKGKIKLGAVGRRTRILSHESQMAEAG